MDTNKQPRIVAILADKILTTQGSVSFDAINESHPLIDCKSSFRLGVLFSISRDGLHNIQCENCRQSQ